jgi:hypothetical protein
MALFLKLALAYPKRVLWGAFHFGTIAEGSGQPRGDCPYRMGQWAKVKCTRFVGCRGAKTAS